jgi:predicted nuclease of predicted toxin-antitoxin system
MKFIADENIENPPFNFLRSQGHDVIDIKEVNPGADDEEVLNTANKDESILMTIDRDFG